MFRKSALTTGTLAVLGALAYVPANAQVMISPILEYKFQDTGTSTASTGYDKAANDTLYFIQTTSATSTGGPTAAISGVDLHGAAGSGVAGGSDVAFNNTSIASMVQGANPSAARNSPATATTAPGGPAGLTGLTSFTVQGWFKTDGTEVLGGSNNTRIVTNAVTNTTTANNQGFYVSGTNASGGGTLQFSVNGSLVNSSTTVTTAAGTSGGAFANDLGTWTFYAATYNSTVTGTNVFLYRGTSTGAVAQIGSGTINAGVVQTNTGTFGLGSIVSNVSSTDSAAFLQRTFDGFLDDTRIYGDTIGGAGALNITQLETLRAADAAGIATPVLAPEPSQFAALGLGVLGLAGLAFKARKRSQLA